MTRLKVLLYIVALSQLVLGALTLFAPATFFVWMGLTPPPPDNNYMLGMLAGRFLVFGAMFAWQARQPEPSRFVVRAMVLIQAIDFLVGAVSLGNGTISAATAAFPMFNAAMFGVVVVLVEPAGTAARPGTRLIAPQRGIQADWSGLARSIAAPHALPARQINPGRADKAETMGVRNYLIDGVSGTSKTTVPEELQRCGYHVVHGDRVLSYQGDPETGELLNVTPSSETPSPAFVHEHHIWDAQKVGTLAADRQHAITFFCGGSRNFPRFIDLFDGVFVLDIDAITLNQRLDTRPEDEFGSKPDERALILRLHATRQDIPNNAVSIDATAPLARVVSAILSKCGGTDPEVD